MSLKKTNEQNTQEITTVAVCAWVWISDHSCHEIYNTLAYYLNLISHLSGFKFEQQQQQNQVLNTFAAHTLADYI